MAALSLFSGSVPAEPKCTIGVPLLGVCIGATKSPSPSPSPVPTSQDPSPVPATASVQPVPDAPSSAPIDQPPAEQWQAPQNTAPVQPWTPEPIAPVTSAPAASPWTSKPSESSTTATSPLKTNAASSAPLKATSGATLVTTPPASQGSPIAVPPMTEQASEATKEKDLNSVFIGTIFVHMGIAIVWFALFHLPDLTRGAKTVLIRGVRQPRHLNPR